MNKKLLATVLASTMLLGSVSAYAAVTEPTLSGGNTTVSGDSLVTTGKAVPVTAEVAAVTISVDMPLSVPILFNPYKLDKEGQVLSPKFEITNNSDTPVKAILTKWEVSPISTGGPTIVAAPVVIDPLKPSIKKDTFIWLQGGVGTLPNEDFVVANDKLKVVPAKTGPATAVYGIAAKGDKFVFQFKGNMNDTVVWNTGDKVIASPTFKFEPTAVVTP